MTQTKVLVCTCLHKVQDEIYGRSNRVHNFGKKANAGSPGWRCTVCTKPKPAPEKEIE